MCSFYFMAFYWGCPRWSDKLLICPNQVPDIGSMEDKLANCLQKSVFGQTIIRVCPQTHPVLSLWGAFFATKQSQSYYTRGLLR